MSLLLVLLLTERTTVRISRVITIHFVLTTLILLHNLSFSFKKTCLITQKKIYANNREKNLYNFSRTLITHKRKDLRSNSRKGFQYDAQLDGIEPESSTCLQHYGSNPHESSMNWILSNIMYTYCHYLVYKAYFCEYNCRRLSWEKVWKKFTWWHTYCLFIYLLFFCHTAIDGQIQSHLIQINPVVINM